MRSSRDARKASNASRAAQTPDATWLKSTKMEARRCVRQSRDAHEAIPEPSEGDGYPGLRLTVSPASTRRSEDGEQGQEHEEEHGEEAGSKDAEREAAGQEGEEVAAQGTFPNTRPGDDSADQPLEGAVADLLSHEVVWACDDRPCRSCLA